MTEFDERRLERDQLSRDASDARRLLGICKAANVLHIARIDALEQAISQAGVLLRWAAAQPCQCEDVADGGSGGPICAPCAAVLWSASKRTTGDPMTCTLDLTGYYAAHGATMTTHTLDRTQQWRQVGWLGIATNHVWSLDDPEWQSDPAGVSPLWLLVFNEPPPPAVDLTAEVAEQEAENEEIAEQWQRLGFGGPW